MKNTVNLTNQKTNKEEMSTMENLVYAVTKNIIQKLNKNIERIESLEYKTEFATKTRIKQLENKEITEEKFVQLTVTRETKRVEKEIAKETNKIKEIMDSGEIEKAIIQVDWKKGNMGNQARAKIEYIYKDTQGNLRYTNVEGQRTSGYGYDKESTAISEALNLIPQLTKALYEVKSKNLEIGNRELFGYGSGYEFLPAFEGGVGVSVYNSIFKAIGYDFKSVAHGNNFDVYEIVKK